MQHSPSENDVKSITRFIEIFSAPGFDPLLSGEEKTALGLPKLAANYPMTRPEVDAFLKTIMQPCWTTMEYDSDHAQAMLNDDQRIAVADLDDIRQILTGYNRGERFCEGFHALMISNGQIIKVLKRIEEIL